MRGLVAGLILTAAALPATAQVPTPLRCTISEKWYCDAGRPCRSAQQLGVKIAAWSNYFPASGEYERCDPKGCDRYQANVQAPGAFTTIELQGRGALAKIGPGGVFSEVVTLGTGVWISYGKCSVR